MSRSGEECSKTRFLVRGRPGVVPERDFFCLFGGDRKLFQRKFCCAGPAGSCSRTRLLVQVNYSRTRFLVWKWQEILSGRYFLFEAARSCSGTSGWLRAGGELSHNDIIWSGAAGNCSRTDVLIGGDRKLFHNEISCSGRQ